MKLNFHRIIIENFLSIGSADIGLSDRGFTLVNGVNNNPKDSAKSNGSGKSSIFEAISWVLTGETIRGVKDVVNMFSDGGTAVTIYFSVDQDEYIVSRYKNHSKYKTDLKFSIDGEDKSGKGIKDSQKLLEIYLPDLTSQLLGSVVLLGQGLPQRFTNNTPAGRKEVLEKLSKSDFMVEDLKNRISARQLEIQKELREKEDEILVQKTKKSTLEKKIEDSKARLSSMENPKVYEDVIDEIEKTLEVLDLDIYTETDALSVDIKHASELKDKKAQIQKEFSDRKYNESMKFTDKISEIDLLLSSADNRIRQLNKEILDARKIKDCCPTCGRKFDNVFIPDVSKQEAEIESLKAQLAEYQENKYKITKDRADIISQIEAELAEATKDLSAQIREADSAIELCKCNLNQLNSRKNTEVAKLNGYTKKLSEYESTIKYLNDTISSNTTELNKLGEELVYNNECRDNLEERVRIVNRFGSLITRDFRGQLLKNVIKYIDTRAKEYCKDVFGTTDLDFILEGNNIDIKYCGKYMESLSGGEKQKIDLIIQFSIRDMLCQFLDFRSNIIALDEIFDALDSVSCDKVIDLISKKLYDIDSVFIITHHQELGIPADSTITVTKNSDGVSIVC